MSPPAVLTAFNAASESLRRRSRATCSRRAFVFELPLGATPVRIFLLSLGVKFTKDTETDLSDPLGLLLVLPLLLRLEDAAGAGALTGLGVFERADILRSWLRRWGVLRLVGPVRVAVDDAGFSEVVAVAPLALGEREGDRDE